ncbi:MAG: SDR family NAD(P)-dependent oxidoreductase [Gammaproteobacteria bacterium]
MASWLKAGNNVVITGGANGIGLAAASRYLELGLNVLIADVNEDAMNAALDSLPRDGGELAGALCDVADFEQVEKLKDTAYATFGDVHCVMNNAGAGFPPCAPWENLETWKKQVDINLWGIVHGCQAFIPAMLASGVTGAIINTGSKQGITNPPGGYAYNLSKAGVLAYTQSVAHALRQENAGLSAHLLVPGFTYSNMIARFMPEKPAGAWTTDQVIDFMLASLAQGDFYILCPDNDTPRELDEKRIQWNADDLIKNRPALSRWHPDFESEYNAFTD